jgi:hypothetical protein
VRAQRFAPIALAAGVVLALGVQLPEQLGAATSAVPVVQPWDRPDDQYRAVLGDVPYELLRIADTRMPRDASVLLVTPGTDVRHREYTTFHRALYFLAPRPVRWITPAPGDGTWEARWWTTAPLTSDSICAEASRAGATHLLLLDLPPPSPACAGPTWDVQTLPDGTLVALEPGTAGRAEATPSLPGWWPVLLALAVAVPLLLGGALVTLILRRGLRLGLWHAAALAWILGTGAVTLAEAGLQLIGVPQVGRLLVVTVVAVAAAVWSLRGWWRARAAGATPHVRLTAIDPISGGLAVIIGLEIALVALLAIGRPLSIWDGWASWGMKARAIFLEGGVTETIYADPTRGSALLDYPLHLPLLESWVYSWLGTPDDRLVGVVGLLTFVSLLGPCYGAMRRWNASIAASLAVVAVIGAMVHVWRLAAAGFADVPLALLLTAAAIHLVAWLEEGFRGDLVVAAASAGLMGWTKKEGLVLLAILVLVAALAGLIGRDPLKPRARRAAPVILAAGVLLSGGWWLFVVANSVPDPTFHTTFQTVAANAGRIPTIVSMQLAMLAGAEWSFIWPIAALLLALVVIGVARRDPSLVGAATWVLPATAALSLLALSASYITTTFEPYTAQILSSGYRIALQVLPITVLWIGRTALAVRLLPAAA